MANKWIQMITGQPLTESSRHAKVSALRQAIGEAEPPREEPKEVEAPEADASLPSSNEPPAPEIEAPPNRGPGQPELGASTSPVEGDSESDTFIGTDSQVAQQLVSSWMSGSKMDVATRLLYTPVDYSDFIRMAFRIGETEALELASIMDVMSMEKPGINQPEDADAIMTAPDAGSDADIISKIAARRAGRAAAPAGETAPQQDATI
jgi:hypothetical protein